MNVPDDLKTTCPNCSGKGAVDRLSFSDPSTVIQKACRVCKGEGWLWALDQQEMAERIGKLEAENARLSAPVTDAVMEELAAMEHERWSSQAIAALTDMTDARRERWTRQARLLYVGLTDAEKEQDRQQVRKTLTILAARKGAA